MSILGIDFGLAKIGLALADGSLAEPLGVISAKDDPVAKIKQICDFQKIEKIIIGVPEGKLAEKVRLFAEEIGQITGLPVEFQAETLTTREAQEKLRQTGRSAKKRRQIEDAAAAAIILQAFLDRRSEPVVE